MNSFRKSISYGLILFLVVFSVLTFMRVKGYVDLNLYFSILYGGIITTTNFILGVLSIKFGVKKSTSSFLIFFFGGMVFRMFLVLIAVFICLKFLEINENSFIFSVFIFYFFYLIIEIFYVVYRNK